MYRVLYRKWRPQKFEDVVGQPQVTVTLRNELKNGRISHAYLFTGSRGTGKTTCAKILAKAVNCLHPAEGDPCGECEICRGIDNGSVMDVVEIDAASNNGVDNIRTLRDEANFTPASGKYRVYIVDEVHMLSAAAFNALLKTLEEPPAYVLFILATTELHKIPATILSRCQRFDFKRISQREIADRLLFVAEEERVKLQEDAAMMIAGLSDGAMRDALSLLDQCMGTEDEITLQTVQETAGLAGRDYLFRMTDCLFEKDISGCIRLVDELYNHSKDMIRLCEELCSHYRGLMLQKTMQSPREILLMSDSEWETLVRQSERMKLSDVLHGIEVFTEASGRMARGGNKRTEMEMALIRLCTEADAETLQSRVETLEKAVRKLSSGEVPVTAAPAPVPAEAPRAAEKPAEKPKPAEAPRRAEPAEKAPSSEELMEKAEKFRQWPDILQILRGYSQSIAQAFSGSSAYISGDYVLIDAPKEIAFELLRKSSQRDKMRDAIRQVTGRVYKLGPYKKQEDRETEKADDPMELLAKKAGELGIEVTIE